MSSPVAVPAAPVAPVAPPAEGRTAWVDNLRTLMIVLVVNFHACITYSHVGDWYYFALPKPGLGPTVAFALWEAHLQAFFMGLLFFVGGYFADRSLARRGARAFMRERLRRLGVPTLFYMLAIQPLIVIGMHPKTEPFAAPWTEYARYVLSGQFVGSNGPMWFAFALLIFCGVFALVGSRAPRVRFTPWSVLIFAVTLGLVTFLVRLVQPMGTNILNFRLGFFPQYIAAFVLGIAVSRQDLLTTIAESRLARRAGACALVLGPVGFLAVAAISLPLPKTGLPPFTGGWNLPALAYALWEQLTGIALALGAMSLCARRLPATTPWSTWLADRSFAVYVLHSPILVALALTLQPLNASPFLMAFLLTFIGLALSFAAADLARRIPVVRAIS